MFEDLWGEHVDFGTSRSHKKLLGKKRHEQSEWRARLEAKTLADSSEPHPARTAVEGGEDIGGRPKKNKRQKLQTVSVVAQPGSVAAAAAQTAAAGGGGSDQRLSNKGRWGGTMAAKLLEGLK